MRALAIALRLIATVLIALAILAGITWAYATDPDLGQVRTFEVAR